MSPGSTRKLPPAGWRRTALTGCLLRSLSKAASAVLDNGDGTYGVSYTPQEAGAYSVWVCVRAQHVQVRRLKTFSILRKVAPRRRALTPPPPCLCPRPAGVSVCADCLQEVAAPQRNLSLLLLLLQRRVQRGPLRLPRNHARYRGTVRANQASAHLSGSVSQGASKVAATGIKDTPGSCTGPAAAAR